MYMHMSIFLLSGLLQFAVNKFFMFVNFSVVLRAARVICVPLGVICVTLNKKKIFLRVFDLKN